jgi:hypothetical protein
MKVTYTYIMKHTGLISFSRIWLSSFPRTIIEETVLSPMYVLGALSKIGYRYMDLFLGSQVWSIGLYVWVFFFMPVSCCFGYYSFKSSISMPLALVFLFRSALAIRGLLWFYRNFRIFFFCFWNFFFLFL